MNDGKSCNDQNKPCSVTHTVLIDSHDQLPPYIPGSNESDCAGCSAEGQFKPPEWTSRPGLINDLFIWLRNNESVNGKPDIFTFFTYEEYSDGTVSAESLTVINKSNREISVSNVFFKARWKGCQEPSCMNMSTSTEDQSYYVNHPVYLAPRQKSPGLGLIQEKSQSTVSLTPSGFQGNQSNTWTQSYDVTLVVQLSSFSTTEYYAPIIYELP